MKSIDNLYNYFFEYHLDFLDFVFFIFLNSFYFVEEVFDKFTMFGSNLTSYLTA